MLGHLAQHPPFSNNSLQNEKLKYVRSFSQKSARMKMVEDSDGKDLQKPCTSHQRRSSQKVMMSREREESGYLNDYGGTFPKGQIFSARTTRQ